MAVNVPTVPSLDIRSTKSLGAAIISTGISSHGMLKIYMPPKILLSSTKETTKTTAIADSPRDASGIVVQEGHSNDVQHLVLQTCSH